MMRLSAWCAAAMVAGVSLVGIRPAVAAAAGVTLHYTCTLSALPSQPMTANLTWNAPPSIMVGQAAPTVTIDATATVGPTVTGALGFVGAATVEGSVAATGVVAAPEGNLGTALRLTVPRSPVPSSGPMTVQANGTTPGLVFHRPGHATIVVGNDLALHFTPRDAGGNPTMLGSVDLSCTLDPGQNTVVFAFDITSAPVAPPRAPPQNHSAPGPGTRGPAAVTPTGSPSSATGPIPSTPSTTTAALATADPPTSTDATTTVPGSAVTTALVRNASLTGVSLWLAMAGILAAALAAIGCAWWLLRRRQRRVPER